MNQILKYLIIGLGIRLAIAPFFMHLWDITTIFTATDQFLSGLNPYSFVAERSAELQETTGLPLPYYGFAYLPTPLFVYAPFYYLYTLFSGIPIVGGHSDIYTGLNITYPAIFSALLAIKLPIILADGVVIYLLAGRNMRAAKIYAFSPYVIFITAAWGQFDPLVGLALLASYLSFAKNKFLSGILYGISLMKIYTIVAFGAYLAHTYKEPKQLLLFLAGVAVPMIPIIFFLYGDASSFLDVVVFQATRPTNGVNIFYALINVRSLASVTFLTTMTSIVFLGAVIGVTYFLGRKKEKLPEFLTALMLTYIIFAPVTNEQLLAALIPIGLISRNFSHKLVIFPLAYIAVNSTYHYFAIPIFFSDVGLRAIWDSVNLSWGALVATFQLQLRYLFGVGLGLSAFWLLRNTFSGQKKMGARVDFKTGLSAIRSHKPRQIPTSKISG